MSRQVRIDHLGKQWDEYAAACGNLFGAPSPDVVASISSLPHSSADIILAAKVMIFCAPRVKSDEDIASIIRQWLRYLPCFLQEDDTVARLNTHWHAMLNGDQLDSAARVELDAFFAKAKNSRLKIQEEIDLFLDRAAIIPREDPLALHKACILLGVEYFSSTPPLGRTLRKVLFPSFS